MDEIDFIEEFFLFVAATREAALDELPNCYISLNDDLLEEASAFSTSFTLGMAHLIAKECFELDDEYETLFDASLAFKEYGSKGFVASTLLKLIWQELFNLYQSYFNSYDNDETDDIHFAS